MDGNSRNCEAARTFFQGHFTTRLLQPMIVCEFVTPDSAKALIEDAGFNDGEIDFPSLDIDSIELWVLGVMRIRPRVIMV